VAGCCECGDEPSGPCATELVNAPIRRIGLIIGLQRSAVMYFCVQQPATQIPFTTKLSHITIGPCTLLDEF
jgi:hypothetical protein